MQTVYTAIQNDKLTFTSDIQLSITQSVHPSQKSLQLTNEQQRVASLVAAGVLAKVPLVLFGPCGAGKTDLVRALASTLGIKLGVVQFNSSSGSSQITATLEMDGGQAQKETLCQQVLAFTTLLFQSDHPAVLQLSAVVDNQPFHLTDAKVVLTRLLRSHAEPLGHNQAQAEEMSLTIPTFRALPSTKASNLSSSPIALTHVKLSLKAANPFAFLPLPLLFVVWVVVVEAVGPV